MLPSSAEQPLGIGCSVSAGVRYQRHEPEKTLLHRIVREHLATFLVEAQDRYPSGERPRFIRAEFERYLRCRLLCHGFARVRCSTCHDELLVAFPARVGVSVHHALGDGWPTLRYSLATMCFPPFRFGSGS